ncbi:MAG: hypothetical protein ACOC95_05845 [Planctomycetota bacterium]
MGAERFLERVAAEDGVVFVGAHPDDETLVGPLLAWCADHCRDLVVASLTRGQSGWNLGPADLMRTLAQDSHACYVSQYRLERRTDPSRRRTEQWLVRATALG